jgi:uncharacterized protein (TIGR03000 family)
VSFDVRVPKVDAEIWFEGRKTGQTGLIDRRFVSPPLTPGVKYTYEIRVRWFEDRKVTDQTRRVRVHAGERVTVDFTQSE